MDRRDRPLISLISIFPPTNLAPGTQWFARYSSTGVGSAYCSVKNMGAPHFERPVMKYTSSNSMVISCIPIWNPCSTVFHKLIMYSRRRTSFFIFCLLKNLRRLQFLNAALDQGIWKVTTWLRSCSLYFHSIMTFSEFTYNHHQSKVISHAILTIFGQLKT